MIDPIRSVNPAAGRSVFGSDIVVSDDWAFVSGLGPFDLRDEDAPLPEYVEAQTAKIFANLDTILQHAGFSKADVLNVRVSLTDFARYFDRMNGVYVAYFGAGALPTRSCVGVSALPRGASIEMDFVLRKVAGENT